MARQWAPAALYKAWHGHQQWTRRLKWAKKKKRVCPSNGSRPTCELWSVLSRPFFFERITRIAIYRYHVSPNIFTRHLIVKLKRKKKGKRIARMSNVFFFLNERQMFDVETKIVRMEQRTSCEGVSRVRWINASGVWGFIKSNAETV